MLAAGTALVGCASVGALPCTPGERPAISDALYFGTLRSGGPVTADEWQRFLTEVITPRFPEGLTVWPAAGQWRAPTGIIQKEASYVLQIVHPDSPAHEAALREVIGEYKARFQQEAVLRARTLTCVSF